MQLEQLLSHITYEDVQGSPIQEIADICYHSGRVKCGSLFVCLKGFRTDGHEYFMEALGRGASAVVVEKSAVVVANGEWILYTKNAAIHLSEVLCQYDAAVILVDDTRAVLAKLSAAFFDYPARKLRMVGITGTKGKTTTAFLVAQILKNAGYLVGMIGTVLIDDGRKQIPAEHTTPEAYELQKYLAQMVEHGCDCCVMEVSSQGIKMQRVAGIWYDIGVFLNIEPDHIGAGEHESFAEYLACKSRLLQQCSVGIVNRDEPKIAQVLRGHICEIEYFSMKHPANYIAENIRFYMDKGRLLGSFTVGFYEKKCFLTTHLPGLFNVSNALAAVAVASHFDVTEEQMKKGLLEASVPGRCEYVPLSEEYVLLIDYAHNEMSLKNLLEMLRDFGPKRLVVLFGCGGNRSRLRRGRMGEAAGHMADFTILTSDNPRWEDPEVILDDIEDGMRETGGSYVRISNRREAIIYAVKQAQPGDIIVIAGKGHEGYQEICGKKYPMLDRELVLDAVTQEKED